MGSSKNTVTDGDFIETLSEEDLASYLADNTLAMKKMCKRKGFSALAEIYGLAVSILDRRQSREGSRVTAPRMTG